MRILSLADLPHRPVDAHGSRGFSVGAFGISADAHLVAVTLTPGGTIGPHPAGRATAARRALRGGRGRRARKGTYDASARVEAAVWEPGEVHETRSPTGMVAMIVEGDLDIGAPGEQIDPGDV